MLAAIEVILSLLGLLLLLILSALAVYAGALVYRVIRVFVEILREEK